MLEVDAMGQPVVVEDLDADWLLALLEEKKYACPCRRAIQAAAGRAVVRAAPRDRRHRRRHLGRRRPARRAASGRVPRRRRAPRRSPRSPRNRSPPPSGVSTLTGMKLIADALDLQHRLPRIWRLVEAPGGGAVEGPPGRPGHPRVVQGRGRVRGRPARPAGWPPAGSVRSRPRSRWRSPSTTPSSSRRQQKQGRKGWHVTLRHPAPGDYDGTSYLDVAGDTLDLTAFHDLVLDQAAQLKALGDTDDLEIRKAKALGVIAAQQATLDLAALTGDESRRRPGGRAGRDRPGAPAADRALRARLAHRAAAPRHPRRRQRAVGEVERLGPATVEKIRDWLGRSEDVIIRPCST